jgi:hypothetical protein
MRRRGNDRFEEIIIRATESQAKKGKKKREKKIHRRSQRTKSRCKVKKERKRKLDHTSGAPLVHPYECIGESYISLGYMGGCTCNVVVVVVDGVPLVVGDARCWTGGGEAQPLAATTGSGSESTIGGCINDEKMLSSSCGNIIGGWKKSKTFVTAVDVITSDSPGNDEGGNIGGWMNILGE